MTFDEIWSRIELNAGQVFALKRGQEFTYEVRSGCVWPNRVNRNLHMSQFKQAFELLPLTGPGAIQHLQGPSYIFAILSDTRIVGS